MKKTSVVFLTDKPFWQPPDWVFSVVWPILYTLEGFALWPVIDDARWGLASLFAAQALMAMMWTWTFSTFSRIKTAFWLLVTTTIVAFAVEAWLMYEYFELSAVLFLPYIIWCTNACTLNGWYAYPAEQEPLLSDYR